jgi:hypothetical protein
VWRTGKCSVGKIRKMGMQGGMSVENVVYASERVDVVRCGECRWGRRYGKLIGCENEDFEHRPMSLVDEDWFCKDGERGGDNGENA